MNYIHLTIFAFANIVFTQSMYTHAKHSTKNVLKKTELRAQPKYSVYKNWPTTSYQGTQDNVSLTVQPLTQDETVALFCNDGLHLLSWTEWGMRYPIVPIHITIKNLNDFPILLSEKHIDIGSHMLFFKNQLLNMQHVLDSLNNSSLSSTVIIKSAYNSLNSSVIRSHSASKNPLHYHPFITLDTTYPLSSLPQIEKELLFTSPYTSSKVSIKGGETQSVLFFVWAKDIHKKNITITLARKTFTINFNH